MTWKEKIIIKIDELEISNVSPLLKALCGYVFIIAFGLVFFPKYMLRTVNIENISFAVYLANTLIPLSFFVFGYYMCDFVFKFIIEFIIKLIDWIAQFLKSFLGDKQ